VSGPADSTDDGVDLPRPRHGLAQRTGWQRAAIPSPRTASTTAISTFAPTVVLQAVIGQDHIAFRIAREQRAAGGNAIVGDHDG
jgi:hypothetical protein